MTKLDTLGLPKVGQPRLRGAGRVALVVGLFAVLLRATPAIRNIEMVVGPTTKSLIQFTPMFPTNLKVVQVSGPSVDEHDHLDCSASWEKIGEPVKDYQPGNLVLECGHGRKFFVSELDFTPTAGR